ncbi:hypothetical protein JOQ06_005271 [Pogonophryne albipinna]|uniref:Uncharacterized protein n=1 Tax=Pogonophryne albipinna TaxID=1090488 RepID=A0AAD6FPB0_9TELE|nr:hypothetical protein JOQ06_005271 [Pogonophryne albipinna]
MKSVKSLQSLYTGDTRSGAQRDLQSVPDKDFCILTRKKKGDPWDVCVSGAQRSGHDSVGVHQLVSQIARHTGGDPRPGDGGGVQLETLTHTLRNTYVHR